MRNVNGGLGASRGRRRRSGYPALPPGSIAVLLVAAALTRGASAEKPAPSPPAPPSLGSAVPGEELVAAPCLGTVPGMGCVAGGSFLRGNDGGPKNERPAATVWVDTFYMDRTEVTAGAYEACVKRKACTPARTIYRNYSDWNQPKVGQSWYQAKAYCEAMGKHLPTEAEWEKAARGTDGRAYPWGDEVATCELAIIENRKGKSCGVRNIGGIPEKGKTFPVGSRAPNQYGLYDMAGNAWEWTADWYSKSYERCGKACTKPNPKGPCDGAERCKKGYQRVVRGGSWYWPASYATTTHRHKHWPKNKPYHHYGFRCAASLDEAKKLRAAARRH